MPALPLLRDSKTRTAKVTERPSLTVVQRQRRRRWPALVGVLAWSVVFLGLLGAAVFHTQLAGRQLSLDHIDRQVSAERERFDELRYERAELRSPVRLAEAASALGMYRGDVSTFLAVTPEAVARQRGCRPSRRQRRPDRHPHRTARSVPRGQERHRGRVVKPATRTHSASVGKRTNATASTRERTSDAQRRIGGTTRGRTSDMHGRTSDNARRHPPAPRRRAAPAPDPATKRATVRTTPPRRTVSRFRSGSPRHRLIVALIVIGAVLIGLIGRVAYLQTTEADTLRSAAADQWTRSITIQAQRGTMFDRHGAEFAMSVPAVTVSINPKLIDNGPATVQALDDLLDLPDDETAQLLAEIESKDRGFVFVRRQADADIGDDIAALKLAGVNVDRESRREMPGGDTGRSVIGRTNIDGQGISGLELQFDDLLTGTGGEMRREVAPGGRSIPGSESVTAKPVAGDDLVLSLDRSVQYSTEQVLLEQVAAIGAKGATAIAMDTDTGEIYSMASVRMNEETGQYEVTAGNFAAVDAYEPGSVAKVITIASALSEGLVTPDTSYVVPWRKQYYDDLLKDSHEHPDDVMSVSRILTESSNIGTIFVQQEM